jgi:hypothetical protein
MTSLRHRRCLLLLIISIISSFWWNPQSEAAPPAPPQSFEVLDGPNDAGKTLQLRWQLSTSDDADVPSDSQVREYRLTRTSTASNDKPIITTLSAGVTKHADSDCRPGVAYTYRLVAVSTDGTVSTEVVSPAVTPHVEWFDQRRLWLAIIVGFVCAAVIVCTELAKRGWSTYVRPLAGLSAIEEAVGRSTEMGRPMLFVPGIMDLDQIETVAGLTILARVGEKAAEYDTPLEVPTARALVMTAAKETLAGSYLLAGRPESFSEDRVYYITDEQFGYVASVCGWMSRERPAACFYLGKFFAESLLLAETGNAVGAIQLAGTAEPAQLPFFVAACDYTLIGEELFAASAYLSGEPQQLGTLKGQDVGKLLAAALLIIGCLLATSAQVLGDGSSLAGAHRYLMQRVLSQGEG